MLPDFTLDLQGRQDWNSALPETRPDQNGTRIQTRNQNRTRIQVLCQAKVIGLQLSAQAEVLQLESWVQEMEMKKKKVGQEGLRRGKREGRRERSVKSLVLYLVRVLWPVVHVSRRPGTKGFQLRQLGLVPSAGKLVRKYPEWSGCQSQWRVSGTLHWKKTDNGHGE